MAQELKELRSDENDPLFDKTNMLKKEFPSDFRQIRYFTLLIVQSAPTEIKELNLLEQQISEVIKNAVKHGNHCDINKKVTVWYSFSPTHAHIIVQDEGEGFRIWKNGMNLTRSVLNVFTTTISCSLLIMFLSVQRNQTVRTAVTLFLLPLNIGTADLFTMANAML